MPGKYRTRFYLDKPTFSKEETYGESVPTFAAADPAEVWAEEVHGSAREVKIAGVLVTQVGCVIKVRGYPDIQATYRLRRKHDGKLYLIDGVAEGDNELILSCTQQRTPDDS